MLGTSYEKQNCSAARALELVGERWSLLILRDALFRGMNRFSEFERSLGIAPNILAKRLDTFVESGLMQRTTAVDDGAPLYRPTPKGLAFKPVIMALTEWGDRWAAPEGPPVYFEHRGCKGRLTLQIQCAKCASPPAIADICAMPSKRRRTLAQR
jgi:DNA-binding HxlR family transcriptional regulator